MTWPSIVDDQVKHVLLGTMKGNRFILAFKIRVELIGELDAGSLSANTFSRSRISLETSRPVPQNKPLSSSPPPHVFTRTGTNNIGRI